MSDYVCSECGKRAFHDGRCGDGPVLLCRCAKRRSRWVNDGRGGYRTNPTGAKPIPSEDYENSEGWDENGR